MNSDLDQPLRDRQTLDTRLENVFSEEPTKGPPPSAGCGPDRLHRMGRRGLQGRRLQSGSLCRSRDDPRRSPRRTAGGRHHRPGAAHDRAYLIDLVDEAGYLPADLAQGRRELGASLAEIEAVLAVLQSFDRQACALATCANASPSSSGNAIGTTPPCRRWSAISNCWPSENRGARKLCGVDDEDFSDMIKEIRQLDPKPGLAFGTTLMQTVVPDVFVRPSANGDWMSNSTATRCRACLSTRPIIPKCRRRRKR